MSAFLKAPLSGGTAQSIFMERMRVQRYGKQGSGSAGSGLVSALPLSSCETLGKPFSEVSAPHP